MVQVAQSKKRTSAFRRWTPLVLLAVAILASYAFGLHEYLSVQSLARNSDKLHGFVDSHLVLSLAAFIGIYVAVVALSLPGAALLSISGSFAFGWLLSVPASILAATAGSVIVFQVVKTSLGARVAERAGPFARKLRDGFARDSFNYLLFLRLTPVFPFFAVNAVAGLCGISLRTFVLATIVGIIPGSLAFGWIGRGLESVIDRQLAAYDTCAEQHPAAMCDLDLSAFSLLTPQMLLGLAALGAVALIPVAIRKLKGRT
jgi:uncharacterized membrane protein YdjX (TVP38/TMEM64 family)